MASGTAIVEAAELVREKGRKIAAHVLEAAAADIEFEIVNGGGRFVIAGTDRCIGLMDLAERLRGGERLPEDVPQTLSVSHVAESPPFAYPTAAISPRSRSIRKPASPKWCATAWSTISV